MTETFREQQDRLFRERVEREAETKRKAAEYEQQQADRRELARIEADRAELEAHLRRRGERFVEVTGEQPSRSVLEGWRDEFASKKVAAEEAEREQRYERAAANDGIF